MEYNRPESYEHYALIRTNPSYRNFIMLEEMRAEMEPPLSPPEKPEPIIEYEPYPIPIEPREHMTRIRKLEEDLEGLRNYVVKNVSQRTPKREYKTYANE
jgi:hypothetical protein